MDLVLLLSSEYAAKVNAEKPDNLCQHMVVYIRQEFFKKKINFPAAFVKKVLRQKINDLVSLPNVITVNRQKQDDDQFCGRVTVVGDLHGQFRDLGYLLGSKGPVGFPSKTNQILVNGDMVDRGDMSIETVIILSLISLMVPGSVHMLKGNHEHDPGLNRSLGFDVEVKTKYPGDKDVKWLFRQLFAALPVAAVIDNAVFVVHGGLGRIVKTIKEINNIVDRAEDILALYELFWNGEHVNYTVLFCNLAYYL